MEQGKEIPMFVKVTKRKDFEGEAVATLYGLPCEHHSGADQGHQRHGGVLLHDQSGRECARRKQPEPVRSDSDSGEW
jgi:hypothetical protein